MLNNATIMGRFVRDPELRRTQSGTPVASFTLAVDRDFTSKETGKRECDFFDCVAWNGTAEFVDKYFHKGNAAVVSGRLQARSWDDKDGNKRRTIEIIAEHIYFGATTNDSRKAEKSDTGDSGTSCNKEPGQQTFVDLSGEADDELPF